MLAFGSDNHYHVLRSFIGRYILYIIWNLIKRDKSLYDAVQQQPAPATVAERRFEWKVIIYKLTAKTPHSILLLYW